MASVARYADLYYSRTPLLHETGIHQNCLFADTSFKGDRYSSKLLIVQLCFSINDFEVLGDLFTSGDIW